MNKKLFVIILTAATAILIGFGGYNAYAKHQDNQHYREAQTAIDTLYKDKEHTILNPQVKESVLKGVKSKINKVEDKNYLFKLTNEFHAAIKLLKNENNAKKQTSKLLKDGILQDDVTESQIDKTKNIVDGLKDKTLRAKLQKMITEASNQLNTQNEAVKTVYSLFSDQTGTILSGNVNRELFNQAKQTAGKIGNEKKKNELNELLAKADNLLTNAEKIQTEAKAKEEALKKQALDTTQAQVNANKQNTGSANSTGTVQATGQQETGFPGIVANSKTAQRTDQIVTVVASGTTAKITLWEKANNIWTQIITTSGFVGSQGIGQASEGSKHTPKGSYTLGFAFGQSNPGTLLPFRQITPNSYWISDVNSNLYNTWQEGPYAGNGNEHLADYANLQYYYAIVINYNMNAVKGAGSAFFLHVSNGRPTAGCVSVPKNVMEQFMKRIHPGAWIINVNSENEVSIY